MTRYANQKKILLAVDCIVFGFDGQELKILLIKRGFEPMKGKWSLMGGFVGPDESADAAAVRVVRALTGLKGVYLEQLRAFTDPRRDPVERTASIAYFALVNLQEYREQLTSDYYAEWVPVNKLPKLIFDHQEMVDAAKKQLRQKARLEHIVFELLPKKFTLPQLRILFESIYDQPLDKRNFNRKILATKLLVQLREKDMSGSRRGAFYYQLDHKQYRKLLDRII